MFLCFTFTLYAKLSFKSVFSAPDDGDARRGHQITSLVTSVSRARALTEACDQECDGQGRPELDTGPGHWCQLTGQYIVHCLLLPILHLPSNLSVAAVQIVWLC